MIYVCPDDNLICIRETNREGEKERKKERKKNKKIGAWVVDSVDLQIDVYILTGSNDSSSRNNKGTNIWAPQL